jgi:ATP-dependent DNA helicase RecQ
MDKKLYSTLKQYYGYDEFRPLQKSIVTDVLNKKDVFVLIPTGGGKSLCYQLPALIQDGITIVVSPLIALMKDQVDGLIQNGATAAFFNSSLTNQEKDQVKSDLIQNKTKLLYVAPERLMQSEFLDFMQSLPISLFAIDEAHCISEWGHDFRPEYRKLSRLKKLFPHVSIIALTATATERVSQDIIKQLGLENANKYQASFNRPNLSYKIIDKFDAVSQTLEYIKDHPDQSGIIYCHSRKNVETLTKDLQDHAIKALSYHAGLDDEVRKSHQEKFIKETDLNGLNISNIIGNSLIK